MYLNNETSISTVADDIAIFYDTDANGFQHHPPIRGYNYRFLLDDVTCYGVKNLQGGNDYNRK